MIDTDKMKQEFIESRIKHNKELKLNQCGKRTVRRYERNYGLGDDYVPVEHTEECTPFRLKEQPLNENPNIMVVKYNNGNGAMVVDLDQMDKLPASRRNKIFKL